jgi:hypothetical protein
MLRTSNPPHVRSAKLLFHFPRHEAFVAEILLKKFLTFSNLGHIVIDNSATGRGKRFQASRPRDFYSPISAGM